MNFDVDEWPDLLIREINEMLSIMLFAWLLIGLVSIFSIIATTFKVEFFHDSFAKNFPYAATVLDTMIWGMRAITFGMLGLFILFFMWGDEDYVMFIMIPQLMLMACLIFLLTEMLRIMIHGADKVPKFTR